MKKYNNRIIILFAFIVISWGLGWPLNKIGLQYMTPLWYTTIRLIVGTGTMMIIVFAARKLSLPKRADFPLILIVGLLQISLYILLTNIGLAYLPAGRAALLAYTTPLWVMPIATLIFQENAGLLRWHGFLLGMSGLFILLSPWQLDWHNPHVIFGSLILLAASFCWGISMLCVRYMAWTKPPITLIPWQLLVGTLPVLLFALMREPITQLAQVHWNMSLILSLLYTGILVTGLSYWSGIIINKALPTTIVSLGFLIVPVFSVIVSAVFMHETITLTTSAAMALIVLGLACVAI